MSKAARPALRELSVCVANPPGVHFVRALGLLEPQLGSVLDRERERFLGDPVGELQ
jgi:hypothetical protein